MRRHFIALAAAASLAATACSPAEPAETVTPTEVVTPAASSAEPTMSESPEIVESPEASPVTSESGSSATSPTALASAQATPEDVDLASQNFAIAPKDAVDKAVEKAGGGFVYSIELDWSSYHNAWVYELSALVGSMDHDVDINADTGEVLELDRDETNDVEKKINLDSPMSWETARDKALDTVQGQITSWKLEYDDDYTAYEFDIEDSSGDEIEVEVNVDTGRVQIDD